MKKVIISLCLVLAVSWAPPARAGCLGAMTGPLSGGLVGLPAPQQPSPGVDLEMLIIEGVTNAAVPPAKVVTSSFLKFLNYTTLQPEEGLGAEQQIKQVFNLKDARLINAVNLRWEKGKSEKASHVFRLDGREYMILVTPGKLPEPRQFHIEVLEQGEKDKASLLDMEFNIPEKKAAVFGFEDTRGMPYFLSFKVLRATPQGVTGGVGGGVQGGVEGGVEGGVVGGVSGGVAGGVLSQERKEFEKGAVRAVGEIKPPRIVNLVEPVYPEKARQAQVEGVVILEARTDEKGNVEDARVLRSIPILDQAAIDAVKKWKYEPMIINGKPQKIVFTVTVRFMMKPGDKEKALDKFAQGAVKAEGAVKPPKLVRFVEPVYPEEARKAGVEGMVILAAKTDASGKVQDVMILRSIPLLNQAAIDAVRQWVYEPLVINNVPTPVVFTVTVRFQLK
jgi:TonB family protein